MVRYISARDHPLAIYPFTHDKALQRMYIDRVMSGGVAINQAMTHAALRTTQAKDSAPTASVMAGCRECSGVLRATTPL